MRHAYLIIAHNEFGILRRLIQMLDDERNDIYVRLDKKVRNFDFEAFAKLPQKSKVYFTKRISVYWGCVSLVQCEYILFKAAAARHYDYYHLLSGADLPLASPDEIDALFERNRGKEFIEYWSADPNNPEAHKDRIKYYHILCSVSGPKDRLRIRRKLQDIKDFNIDIQRRLGVDRMRRLPLEFQRGSQWFSASDACIRYIIENERLIRKMCRLSVCADELFVQMLIYPSPFYANLYPGSLRCIDWARSKNGSNPYTYREEDFDMLIHSGCFWARKFSKAESGRLPDMLYEHVTGRPAPDDL